jgi:predicted permease
MRDLRFWRWRKADDDDLDREIQVHLDLEADERRDGGLPRRDAQLAARRAFGSVAWAKEEVRDMRTGSTLQGLWREVRHAARRLRRSPAFTAATVSTLALAIGANVAIFTVVERVVLNPLPYPDSGRIVMLDFSMPSRNILAGFNSITTRQYFQYSTNARSLSGVAVYRTEERTLTGQGSPERIRVARATPSLAAVLRVTPEAGGWLPAGSARGAAPAAVLSHGLWNRRFGSDPGIAGRIVTLDGVATTVVGVMPARFAFPDSRVDAWVSEAFPASISDDGFLFTAVARLSGAASIDIARAEINQLTRSLDGNAPGNGYNDIFSTALPLHDFIVGPISSALWMLLASAGVVLLVACANVANLFLVRSEARQREIAVRRALGAGSGGIAAYFMSESALLSLAGGAFGLLAAWWGVRLLVALGPAALPRLHEIRLAPVHAVFTLAVTAVAASAFGLLPLVRLGSNRPLHETGRGTTVSRRSHRARQLLMAGQVALSLVLLVASGLLGRSFLRLRALDSGFDPSSALTFQIGLPRSGYADRERTVRAHQAILDRLAVLPGVTSASVVNCVPLSGRGFCGGAPLFKEGETVPPGGDGIRPIVAMRPVAGRFFETMGMPLVQGRGFTQADFHGGELVAVVNDTLTRMAFAGQNPLGKRVRLGPHARANLWFTIVGVVKTTPTLALTEALPVAKVYVPMLASPDIWPAVDVMTYVVRTSVPPKTLAASARAAVQSVDPNLALAEVRTLQDIMDAAAAPRAFTMTLVIIAAGTALLLGLVGVYGAMSYIVTERTGEIGIRMALGAEPRSVARMIVREGAVVAVAGIAAGLATAFVGARLIESLLYGVSPRDPSILAGVTLVLFIVVLLACWLPARRAARLSPLDALRTE